MKKHNTACDKDKYVMVSQVKVVGGLATVALTIAASLLATPREGSSIVPSIGYTNTQVK